MLLPYHETRCEDSTSMTSVPASAAHGHGHPAQHNTRFSNGLLGIIFFLCTEVSLFGALIFNALYLRRLQPVWPPHGVTKLEWFGYPLINTAILLMSGLPCHFADQALEKGKQGWFRGLMGLTIIMGAMFLGGQFWEYQHIHAAFNKDMFGATFFTLTGLHGAHVTVGVIALSTVFIMGLRGRWSKDHHFPVRGVTIYWHFVDAVWVILFGLFYLT